MKDTEKRCQFVFISNSSSDQIKSIYKYHPDWKEQGFVKPDIYDWKWLGYTDPKGKKIEGKYIVIGSEISDIVGSGRKKAAEQTLQAIEYAKNVLKTNVFCFGAATKTLIPAGKLPKDIVFSNGDTLTVAVILEELKEAAKKCGMEINSPKTKILIVGAYGIIGSAMAKNLAKSGCSLLLLGKDIKKLNALNGEINNSARLFTNFNEINEKVDAVVTVTNHPSAILDDNVIEKIGPNILVLDPAWPQNVSGEVCEKFKGELIRLDSGLMTHQTHQYQYGESGIIGWAEKEFPACLCEAMVAATALNYQEDAKKIAKMDLMEISEKNIPAVSDLSKKYAFKRTPFACYKRLLAESDFEEFKQNKAKN